MPPIYSVLSDAEWEVMVSWYTETEERGMVGEINVPAMSLVQGLISGGAVTRFVQLGHYCGYSTLLIGFWLRQMGGERRLVTVDIDPTASAFTEEWVQRAGLSPYVTVLTGSAADSELQACALELVGGPPQMMLVDTSHGYEATKRELELWVPSLVHQGLLLVHGTSVFGQSFDGTGEGGGLGLWTTGRQDALTWRFSTSTARSLPARTLLSSSTRMAVALACCSGWDRAELTRQHASCWSGPGLTDT